MTTMLTKRTTLLAAATAASLLAGCGGDNASAPTPATATASAASTSTLNLAAQAGEKMFVDATLSGSGRMSCASCHDPKAAYGPSNALAVQLGGLTLATAGLRSPPSLRYKDATPPYADLLDNPDGISAPGPGGGFTGDGRAATLADQARLPLLDAREMANASGDDVVRKIRASAYADLFRQAFGATAFDDPSAAFGNAVKALQAYQLEDQSFHPYSSKFDLYAGNKIGGTLTAAETRGLKVFANPQTGNCASCHYQGAGLNGSSALFTDFSYEAIGVP
ncbi:MAG: cytochrome c peroxidase, partial [Burkholderiales bacterium]